MNFFKRESVFPSVTSNNYLLMPGELGSREINLTVRKPSKLAMQVEDGSGAIIIDRVQRDVIIQSAGSGGVDISRVEGRVIR